MDAIRFKLQVASIVLGQPRNGIDLAGLDINSGSCGLIGWYTLNLTYPFGVAWPL